MSDRGRPSAAAERSARRTHGQRARAAPRESAAVLLSVSRSYDCRMARPFASAVAVVALLVASGIQPHSSQAACLPVANWGGIEYLGLTQPRHGKLKLGARLGRARVPACPDTIPPPPNVGDTFVRIRRIRGVPPALAFFNVKDRLVYSARGYFPRLPNHPLHDLYFARVDDYREGARCARPVRLKGRVVKVNSIGDFTLKGKGRAALIDVTAGSRIRGFLRQGHPYLQPGDRLLVVMQKCILRDGAPVHDAIEIKPAV